MKTRSAVSLVVVFLLFFWSCQKKRIVTEKNNYGGATVLTIYTKYNSAFKKNGYQTLTEKRDRKGVVRERVYTFHARHKQKIGDLARYFWYDKNGKLLKAVNTYVPQYITQTGLIKIETAYQEGNVFETKKFYSEEHRKRTGIKLIREEYSTAGLLKIVETFYDEKIKNTKGFSKLRSIIKNKEQLIERQYFTDKGKLVKTEVINEF